jgi:hypothetical protein
MRFSDSLIRLWLHQVEIARLLNVDQYEIRPPQNCSIHVCSRQVNSTVVDLCGAKIALGTNMPGLHVCKPRFCHCRADVAWPAVGHVSGVDFLPCSGQSVKKMRYSDSWILLWVHQVELARLLNVDQYEIRLLQNCSSHVCERSRIAGCFPSMFGTTCQEDAMLRQLDPAMGSSN